VYCTYKSNVEARSRDHSYRVKKQQILHILSMCL